MIIAFGNVFSQVTTEQIYYGASSLSMSASDIALPKNSWSLFVNAAGIARQKGLSLVASSQSHFNQDYLSHSLLGFQFKTSKYGAYGISVENFSVDYSGSSLSAETAIGFHQGIMLRSDRSSSFSIGYGIKYYNIDYTIFRLFTCYGPGQDLSNLKKGMVGIYLSQFLHNEDSIIVKGSLERYRDFIYVSDVAKIIEKSLENEKFYNNIFNLGSGKKTTINELLEVMKHEGNFIHNIEVEDGIIGDMIGCVSDNTKLKLALDNNFKFTKLDAGIKKMINFYNNC